MDELLEQMIKKSVVECEEEHRKVVSSLNGMAGIDIIENKWAEAVEKYREVLRLAAEYEGKINTDTLQKLHTVTNLAEVLEAGHENITPTLRDDKLRDEAKELKQKYLTKYLSALTVAKEAVSPVTSQVEELKETFKCEGEAWYVLVANQVYDAPELEDSLLKLVWEEMAKFFDVVKAREFREIEKKYASSREVMYKVGEKVTEFDGLVIIV